MIFVKNNLKYDTDKMELISDRINNCNCIFPIKKAKLYKSTKGNWLFVVTFGNGRNNANALSEKEAKEILIKNDIEAYEKEFGEIEEA